MNHKIDTVQNGRAFERLAQTAHGQNLGSALKNWTLGRLGRNSVQKILNGRQAYRLALLGRTRRQQPLCVGLLWVVHDLVEGARLHHLALPEHDYLVGDVRNRFPVVADEEHRHSALTLQIAQQIEDFERHRMVKGRRGLVANQQLGVHGHCHGDHHALALPPRQLVGVLLHRGFGLRNLHPAQLLKCAVTCLLGLEPQCGFGGLRDLAPDAHRRIEGRHGLLKDHGFAGHSVCECRPRSRQSLGQQAHKRQCRQRLTRTRLAHEGHTLAGVEVEVEAT